MIDITTLTASAVSVLIPYLMKGGEALSEEAGKSLWSWLTEKFTARNKQRDLDAFKKTPTDQRLQGKVEAGLEDILRENPDLINDMEKMLKEFQNNQSSIIQNSKNINAGTINAGGNVTIGDNNSTLS